MDRYHVPIERIEGKRIAVALLGAAAGFLSVLVIVIMMGIAMVAFSGCGTQGQAMRACAKEASIKCAMPCAECVANAYRRCRETPIVTPSSLPVEK